MLGLWPLNYRLPRFVLVDTSVNITLSTALRPHHVMEAAAAFLYLLSTLILCKCQQCALLPTSVILPQAGGDIGPKKTVELFLLI